jgi:SAM-dependent methyltransferase
MSQRATSAPAESIEESESSYHAHYRFQYLSAAFQLGLFTLLSEEPGSTKADIARRLGLQEQPARILLLGGTAFGLLCKDGDRYYNTSISEPFSMRSDQAPAAFLPFQQHCIYRPMWWFYDSLKENTNIGLQREIEGSATTLYGRLAGHPGLETTFHNMMASVSRLVAEDLAQKIDLSNYTHLLDVGGGTAVNAAELARRWPHLQITIIELPTVAAAANERIVELGLADRVRAVGLDVFNDEFPTGCDCVLFAHFLEIWSIEHIRALLAKASRAVGPNAGIFVVTPYQDDDENGPELAAALSAYFLTIASGEGMIYTPREYEQWFVETGFEPTGRTEVGGFGAIAISGVKKSANGVRVT